MSELMNQLGKTQEEVRRLSARVDRADAMLAKAGDTEHALKEEVQALMGERNQLREVRDSLHDELRLVRGEVDRLKKERDEAYGRIRQTPVKIEVTVDEVERAASEAGWEASDFRVAMDVAKRFGWLAVTVPPTDL